MSLSKPHIGAMLPASEGKPPHEEPEHWRRKAVELRRRAMATADNALAARLHSTADACALVGTELARLPSDAAAESAWRGMRSCFAAPAAVLSLLLLAWTAQMVVPYVSLLQLTAANDQSAADGTDNQLEQHQDTSGTDTGTKLAAVSAQGETASAPPISSAEDVGYEASPGSAVLANTGPVDLTTKPELTTMPDELVRRTPSPPPRGPDKLAPATIPQRRADTRVVAALSHEGERASSAIQRRGGIQPAASQREQECRTYVADHPLQRGHRVYGLACRLPNGRWKIQAGPASE